MVKDKEKITRKIAFNRVKTNIDELINSPHTFESIFNISFKKGKYILFETYSINGFKKINYLTAKESVYKYANYLSKNINSNEHYIGIYLDNSPSWIYSFYGLLMAGFTPVLLSIRANDEDINKIIKKLNIKYIICEKSFTNLNNISISNLEKENNTNKIDNKWSNEIIFMTSGVSSEPKLVSYTGEEITNQIASSYDILKNNLNFASTYNKLLKHLLILPLYHIFGLIAVFIWFSFFNVTFVIPMDLRADSIRQACLMSKVTHIFAVPLFWDTLVKTINFEVNKTNKKEKFNKFINFSIKLQKAFPRLGCKFIRNHLFKNYLNKIFGPSISFSISGGGTISKETLRIVNGLGYNLANGYGATEIGIVCLENSNNIYNRISGSVGNPIGDVKFSLKAINNGKTSLYVKGSSTANKIMVGDKWINVKNDEINTNDLASKLDNGYFINGRVDNLFISNNGENYSIENIEDNINLFYCQSYSIIINKENELLFILSYPKSSLDSQIAKDLLLLKENLDLIKLIKGIYITNREIPISNGIKIQRRKLTEEFYNFNNEFKKVNLNDYLNKVINNKNEIPSEIITKVINVYKKHFSNKEIYENSNFYTDLNGDSLSYFLLVSELEKEFNIKLEITGQVIPLTPLDFSNLIKNGLGL